MRGEIGIVQLSLAALAYSIQDFAFAIGKVLVQPILKQIFHREWQAQRLVAGEGGAGLGRGAVLELLPL